MTPNFRKMTAAVTRRSEGERLLVRIANHLETGEALDHGDIERFTSAVDSMLAGKGKEAEALLIAGLNFNHDQGRPPATAEVADEKISMVAEFILETRNGKPDRQVIKDIAGAHDIDERTVRNAIKRYRSETEALIEFIESPPGKQP